MKQLSKTLVSWASVIDPNAQEQAERTSKMPFIHPHLALIPDARFKTGYRSKVIIAENLLYFAPMIDHQELVQSNIHKSKEGLIQTDAFVRVSFLLETRTATV